MRGRDAADDRHDPRLPGNLVFGEEDDELEDVILRLLAERGETLATSKAGTSGMLAGCLAQRASFRRHQHKADSSSGIVSPNPAAGWQSPFIGIPEADGSRKHFVRTAAAACREKRERLCPGDWLFSGRDAGIVASRRAVSFRAGNRR